MSSDTKTKQSKGGSKKSFLSKLPSNIPFVPVIRRPDYQLRRVRLKFPRSIPTALVIALMLSGVFFIYIGGFYYVTTENLRTTYPHPNTGEPKFIWMNELNEQTIVEGVAAGILMFIGAGGFYLVHYSTQYAYSPSQATKILLIGLALILLSFAALARLFYVKVWLIRDLIMQG
ncbi:MAG: hypothetical protein FK733_11980 [Asgard group archaeon]|nr:hypothetical protein [Asgard group archaeon]